MSTSPGRMEPPTSPTAGADDDPGAHPVHVSVPLVCVLGSLAWLVVLVVTLAVPALRTGERSWWPWTAVAGMALGIACWFYVRRGRGNAAAA